MDVSSYVIGWDEISKSLIKHSLQELQNSMIFSEIVTTFVSSRIMEHSLSPSDLVSGIYFEYVVMVSVSVNPT